MVLVNTRRVVHLEYLLLHLLVVANKLIKYPLIPCFILMKMSIILQLNEILTIQHSQFNRAFSTLFAINVF